MTDKAGMERRKAICALILQEHRRWHACRVCRGKHEFCSACGYPADIVLNGWIPRTRKPLRTK